MLCKLRLARAIKQVKFRSDPFLLLFKDVFGTVDVEIVGHFSFDLFTSRVDNAYIIRPDQKLFLWALR